MKPPFAGFVFLALSASLLNVPAQTSVANQSRSIQTATSEIGNPKNDQTSAIEIYDCKCRRSTSSSNLNFYNAGTQHDLANRYEDAAQAFRQATIVDPKDGHAHFRLGNVYAHLGRWAEAVKSYQQAISLNQKDGQAYNNLGVASSKLGLHGQAAEAFVNATRIFPVWAEPRLNLSSVYRILGRHDAATASYKEAVRLRPDYTTRTLLTSQTETGQAQKSRHTVTAIQTGKSEIENTRNPAMKTNASRPAHVGNSVSRDQEKTAPKAGQTVKLTASSSSGPTASPVKPNASTATTTTDSTRKGATTKQVVSSFTPNNAKAYYKHAVQLGRSGKYEQAIQAFKQAIIFKPNYTDAYYGLGHAYYDAGRFKEAVEAYEQVLRLDPKDDDAYYKLGEAYVKLRAQTGVDASKNTTIAASSTVAAANGRTDGATTSSRPSAASATIPVGRVQVINTVATTSSTLSANNAVTSASNAAAKAVTPDQGPAAATNPTSIYRVGVGDTLDVRVLNTPANVSTLFTVTAGGLLEYPLAGSTPLKVAGLTTDEISQLIAAELKRRAVYEKPEVVVGVREYASHNVIISGLVNDPGTKVIRREAVPLYVVVADAQPRPEASQVMIVSGTTGAKTVVDLTNQAAMNTLIYPGDVLTVRARPQQFFYVGGLVSSPGQKEFHPGMTLTQAILTSGGELNRGGTVRIMRQNADGLLTTTSYNLKDLVSGKMPDPLLQPDDRIGITQ